MAFMLILTVLHFVKYTVIAYVALSESVKAFVLRLTFKLLGFFICLPGFF